MTDVRALADLVAKMDRPTPLICEIEVSPAVFLSLRESSVVKIGAPDPLGLQIRQNAALINRTALVRFADGRRGLWHMDTDSIYIWMPTL